MKKTVFILLIVLSFCLHCHADTIYQETFTASEMYSQASFIMRTPTLNGDYLDFRTGTKSGDVMMKLDLVEAGTISTETTPVIKITLDGIRYPGARSDNDLIILITDGTNAVGAGRWDGWGVAVVWTADNANYFPNIANNNNMSQIFSNSTDIINPLYLEMTMGTETTVYSEYGSSSGTKTPSLALDPTKGLSILLIGHSYLEEYRISSIDVEILGTSTIPETNSFTLILLASLAFISLLKYYK